MSMGRDEQDSEGKNGAMGDGPKTMRRSLLLQIAGIFCVLRKEGILLRGGGCAATRFRIEVEENEI